MYSILDRLHEVWFREWRGSPLWGWLFFSLWMSLIVGTIIAVVFFGFDAGSRCNSNGDCWPEF